MDSGSLKTKDRIQNGSRLMRNARGSASVRILVGAILISMFGFVPVEGYAQEVRSPSVGAAGYIEQIVLPGTELVSKPLVDGSPIVIRIAKVFPHGDSFRYDMIFYGMEPGKFDLTDWLMRKDGSSTEGLPEIPVEIVSLLPPGQIEPNSLEKGIIPRLGGYRFVMWSVVVLWSLILLGLMFMGRKKGQVVENDIPELTLADLLKTRIESALSNRMEEKQYAELERMLTSFWRKRLNIEDVPTHEALVAIKQDEQAGPLMRQLEKWMHSPAPDADVDLVKLLEPFKELPADTPEFER